LQGYRCMIAFTFDILRLLLSVYCLSVYILNLVFWNKDPLFPSISSLILSTQICSLTRLPYKLTRMTDFGLASVCLHMRNGLKSVAFVWSIGAARISTPKSVQNMNIIEYGQHWLQSCHVQIRLDQLRWGEHMDICVRHPISILSCLNHIICDHALVAYCITNHACPVQSTHMKQGAPRASPYSE
jgi:hypothetical protein